VNEFWILRLLSIGRLPHHGEASSSGLVHRNRNRTPPSISVRLGELQKYVQEKRSNEPPCRAHHFRPRGTWHISFTSPVAF